MSSSVIPGFPYSADEEPSREWTVEQVFQWCLLQSNKVTEEKYQQMVASLEAQLSKGQDEIWQLHQELVDEQRTKENKTTTTTNVQASTQSTKSTASSAASKTLHVEIIAGYYAGKTFDLQPKSRAPCMVGRSQGKKFRQRGISLPKDLEVSTTHGKFEILDGKFVFVDTGSTNGTRVGDVELEPDEPLELTDGIVLTCGQTVMKIQLPSPAS